MVRYWVLEASMEPSSQEFAELVRTHQSTVCAAAYGVTGDRALSEDIAQDAFVAAWRALPTLRDPTKVRGWLRGIAKNLAHKATRKAAPTQELDDRLPDLVRADDDDHERVTWTALRALPEKYREALVLYYWEDRSARQVGESLGISEAAAMQRLSRGRALLRDEILRTVEGTLARRRPGAVLTAAIIAAVAASAGGTASAGAASTAAPRIGERGVRAAWKIAVLAVLGVLVAVAGVTLVGTASSVATSETSAAPGAHGVATTALSAARPGPPTGARPATKPHDESSAGAGANDDLDPDGRFTTLAITAVGESDAWLTPALRHALSPCFFDDLVDDPARISVAVRGGKIATVALEPLEHPDVRVVAHAITESGLGNPLDRDALASWLAAGKSIATSHDDPRLADHAAAMTLPEFIGQCAQTQLAGRPVPGPDATHRLQISGQRVTPKKIDREAFTDLDVGNGAAYGPRDARVTIVTFLDIADPGGYCAKLVGVLDQVIAKYPHDVRVVVKLVPFRMPGHDLAAEAIYAAHAQGALWPMLERIAAARDHLTMDDMIAHATALHLDVARFRSELESNAHRDELDLDRDQATTMDIRALPSSIVNGKRVHGALQLEDVLAAVEAAL